MTYTEYSVIMIAQLDIERNFEEEKRMKKIDEQTAKHFFAGTPMKTKNTEVITDWIDDRTYRIKVLLHGNLIAYRDEREDQVRSGFFMTTLAGWNTQTTKARVNGLLDYSGQWVRYHQVKGVLHLGDTPVSPSDWARFSY